MELLGILNNPLSWVVIGIVLMIAEIFTGEGTSLSFGTSGFLVAFFLWVTDVQIGPLWLIAIFSVVGVGVLIGIRRLMKKTEHEKEDINTY